MTSDVKPRTVPLLALLALSALGCSLFSTAPTIAIATENAAPTAENPSGAQPAPTEPPPASSGNGEIAVTGAMTKTFTPASASAVALGNRVSVAFKEADGASGPVVQFAQDIRPGTYPIDDHLHNPVVDVFGEYDVFGDNNQIYLSTSGTLTLTKTGDSFSGTFTFSASSIKDESSVITVTGSFADLTPSP